MKPTALPPNKPRYAQQLGGMLAAYPPRLYAEMPGLCPRIDYRLQWGNDGEVLVTLLTFFRLKAPPVAQQCRL
jgi:hypothetical protein